ncbi:HD domain-containing protein [Actinomadura rupiterrae]|uniref:HD domain-containing protein n=1 Tax=Actinomadura rupiterrae TaxID=559627 RepID=UPI0020A5A1FE|nr:HD domain-containing protein [Actinomadura rupiterrae]MCP2335359.1 GTP pyrophosphokinase [Actinomadura rupiterrae]
MRTFTSWPTWDAARADLSGHPALPVLDLAAEAALYWHGDQTRPTGAPYAEHLLEALEVLVRGAGVSDPATLAAVLLHDVVEDTAATVADVEAVFRDGFGAEFAEEVGELVDWVTKPPAPEGTGRKAKRALKGAYLARLRNAPEKAVLVKLADRTSNVQTLEKMPADFQRRYYAETVIYVMPLAERTPWFAEWFAEWRDVYGHLR